jgi:glutaredoxin 3
VHLPALLETASPCENRPSCIIPTAVPFSPERTKTNSSKRKTVKLYTSTFCPICEVVERFLSEREIQYMKINIDEDPEAKEAFLKLGYDNLPVLDIEGTTILGFNPEAIEKVLKEKRIILKR